MIKVCLLSHYAKWSRKMGAFIDYNKSFPDPYKKITPIINYWSTGICRNYNQWSPQSKAIKFLEKWIDVYFIYYSKGFPRYITWILKLNKKYFKNHYDHLNHLNELGGSNVPPNNLATRKKLSCYKNRINFPYVEGTWIYNNKSIPLSWSKINNYDLLWERFRDKYNVNWNWAKFRDFNTLNTFISKVIYEK